MENREPHNSNDEKQPRQSEQKKVLQLYIALALGVVFSIIPLLSAAITSMLIFCGTLIAAYIIRGTADNDGFVYTHAQFTIRIIWVSSFIALITTTLGSFYMLSVIDKTPFTPCIDQFLNLGGAIPSVDGTKAMFQPCIDQLVHLNLSHLIIAGIICIAPVFLYFCAQYIKGLQQALNHKPL